MPALIKFRRGTKFPRQTFVDATGTASLTFGDIATANDPPLLSGETLLRFNHSAKGRLNIGGKANASLSFGGTALAAGFVNAAQATAQLTFGGWSHGRLKRIGQGQSDLVFTPSGTLHLLYWAEKSTASGACNPRAVAISNDGQTILVAPYYQKLYLSTDGGATKSAVHIAHNWQSVAMSDDGTSLYVAAGDTVVYPPSNDGGIWRSTDGGQTWAKVLTAPATHVACSSDGLTIFVVPNGGSGNFSTDGGDSWTPSGGGSPQSLALSGDGYWVAYTIAGILYSGPLSAPQQRSLPYLLLDVILDDTGNTVFARIQGSTPQAAKSTDGGQSFQLIDSWVGPSSASIFLQGYGNRFTLFYLPWDDLRWKSSYSRDAGDSFDPVLPDLSVTLYGAAISRNGRHWALATSTAIRTA